MLPRIAILAFCFLSLVSCGAGAQTVKILTTFDNSPLTTECDQKFGGESPQFRPCYVMPPAEPRLTPTNWSLAHGNQSFFLTITGPAVVVATYNQSAFLNTPYTIAKYGPPTSAGFQIAIGVNSTTTPCPAPAGFTPSAAADTASAEQSADITATCNLTIAAGATVTLWPITAQRDGVAYFSGSGSVLSALVFPQ
jgi:hypothetical protein